MNQALALALSELIRQGVPAAIDIVQVLAKPEATEADWDALRAKWSKSYDQRIKDAEARKTTL